MDVLGDFNEVKENEGKNGGNMRVKRRTNSFQEFINDCGMIKILFRGQMYTWFNKKGNGLIRERLDKVLVKLLWEESFPKS